MVNPELIITGILVLCCCFCCCISIIGIYFIEESDDDDDKGSCIRPTNDVYNFNGITENLKIDEFNVSGITCAQGYSGENISTAVCNSSGSAYTVSGCSLDPTNDNDDSNGSEVNAGNGSEVNAGNGSEVNANTPLNCQLTYPIEQSETLTYVIEGDNFVNYNFQSFIESSNEDINCTSISEDSASCSGTLNSSGSIDCIQPNSEDGTISCNSSGIFELGGCFNADGGGGGGGGRSVPVDCVGSWGTCGTNCRQTYTITTPVGGVGCTNPAPGATRDCNVGDCNPVSGGDTPVSGTPVNCVGSWGTCETSNCLETYSITTPASNGGDPCPESNGSTRVCESDPCNPCNPTPCENEGVCAAIADPLGYSCTCPRNYIGTRCENEHPCCSPSARVSRNDLTCCHFHCYQGSKHWC